MFLPQSSQHRAKRSGRTRWHVAHRNVLSEAFNSPGGVSVGIVHIAHSEPSDATEAASGSAAWTAFSVMAADSFSSALSTNTTGTLE
jgi:hypothetical protein